MQTRVRKGKSTPPRLGCVGYFSIAVTKYLTSNLKGAVCFGSWSHSTQLTVAWPHVLGQDIMAARGEAHLRA